MRNEGRDTQEHRLPLYLGAREIPAKAGRIERSSGLVFPSPARGLLPDRDLSTLLRELGIGRRPLGRIPVPARLDGAVGRVPGWWESRTEDRAHPQAGQVSTTGNGWLAQSRHRVSTA